MARLPWVSDDDILATWASLKAHGRQPSVRVLREILKDRFGGRCGTNRVYGLISARGLAPSAASGATSQTKTALSAPSHDHPPLADPDQIAQLTAERDAAIKRAELAEFREQATQDRTAYQIFELREKLRRLGVDPFA